jgi:hypothetical protein
MNYKDAINASQIWAARGYDPATNVCVVSVSHYGDKLMWRTGWKGDWKKEWEPIPKDKTSMLDGLDFYPTGPKPDDQINDEMLAALSEIADEYAWEDEVKDDYLEPMGETYD